MKGVLKGFKYISNIFDEEEEDDAFQIGLPTDVKHVAHVGMDGPSTGSPGWMKDFSSERPKSAPLDNTGEPLDTTGYKTSTETELSRVPARRRHHSVDSVAFENSDKVPKSKGTRKHHKKTNSDGTVIKSNRPRRNHKKESLSDQEGSKGDVPESTSPPRKLPDIPKKSRRKKVQDEINKIASKAIPKASSSDGVDNPPPPTTTTTENTGSVGTDSTTIICDGESCQIARKPSP
ncbi:CRIB domain-containing protein [Heracleum sosnowskyi]|uniref:CRIB domain-containing protein n=1 Tax=Heracleum sosnowskyi TaxID=360622 RepID=A0AAD8IG97_9APIA|nr:CRIB domain-containing protein [Heracleum sosnowskyi]